MCHHVSGKYELYGNAYTHIRVDYIYIFVLNIKKSLFNAQF